MAFNPGIRVALLALAAIPLSACASIVEGTTQTLVIDTEPRAACELERDGASLGIVDPTPGDVFVEKSKHEILVRCTREGYAVTTEILDSEFEGWTVGNILLGGVIGLGVDAATGAINEYDASVLIRLDKE